MPHAPKLVRLWAQHGTAADRLLVGHHRRMVNPTGYCHGTVPGSIPESAMVHLPARRRKVVSLVLAVHARQRGSVGILTSVLRYLKRLLVPSAPISFPSWSGGFYAAMRRNLSHVTNSVCALLATPGLQWGQRGRVPAISICNVARVSSTRATGW